MSQTSYSINMQTARQGQLADSGFHDIISGQLSSAGVIGVFGTLMVLDTANTNYSDVKLPAVSGDVTSALGQRGVVVEAQTVPSNVNNPALPPYFPNQYPVPLLRRGRIWVNSEDAVTPGTSHVFVRYANAGAGTIGGFRATTVSSEAAQAPDANYVWLSATTGANQLAVLEINLP